MNRSIKEGIILRRYMRGEELSKAERRIHKKANERCAKQWLIEFVIQAAIVGGSVLYLFHIWPKQTW